MSFNFVVGGAGSGKTKYIYDYMIKKSIQIPDKNILLIVPEQFTMETQRDLVIRHPNKGMLKIEVLSFGRLAFRIFEELGFPLKKTLGDTGKGMVLRKVISDKKNEFTYFNKMIDKYGFIENLKSLITEFQQYEFSIDDIKQLEESVGEKPILHEKIHDLYGIYQAFQQYIEDNYITTEGTLDLLKDKIEQSMLLKDSIIIFDGFYGFTPQQYSIIKKLGQVAEKLLFTLYVEGIEELYQPVDETHLFFQSIKTYNRLREIALELGIKINQPQLINNQMESKEIAHLTNQIFRFPYAPYDKEVKDLYITACVNPIKECEHVCKRLHHLVMNEGYDYRDIAVITGDMESYRYALERLFKLYHIPYFIDHKKNVLANPVVELIRSVLDIFVTNWSYESVFRYIKTGFLNIDKESLDLLENFVLQHGIRGKDKWLNRDWIETFSGHKPLEDYEKKCLVDIEESRKKVSDTLMPLAISAANSKKTVVDITRELYNLLIELQCPQQIDLLCHEFENKGNLLLKREYSQIWKLLMELLDKIVEVLGDETISMKEYAKLIEAGLEQCEMGLVPPSINQVLVGDLERTRIRGVKALFIIGFNDGQIPAIKQEQGVFTEEERDYINTLGKELADSKKKKIYEEHFLVYNALCKPKNKLLLSYSLADVEGGSLRPSYLIKQIKKLMPKLEENFDDPRVCDESYVSLPESTLYYLISEKRKKLDQLETKQVWDQVYDWYKNNEQWCDTLEKIDKGFWHNNEEKTLKESTVNKLYGYKLNSSISRLESYAACPFSYFVQYGLKAEERRLNEVKSPDVGIYFHLILENFARRIVDRGLDWKTLEEDKRNQLLEDTINDITPMLKYTSFLNSNRNKYLKYRLTKISKKAVEVLQTHLERGDFKPKDFELSFGDSGQLPAIVIPLDENQEMQLTGKIDRVDLLEDQEHFHVKIIDYKSGSEGFDMVAIYNGLQLQLIVYLDALINLGEQYYGKPLRPAGIFYFKIDDPILNSDLSIKAEDLDEMLLKQFKLSGLVLSEEDMVKKLDKTVESSSSIIPVRLTKTGFHKTHSSVASYEHFEMLQKYAKKKAADLGQEILAGNVSINPYKLKNNSACDFCQYSSVCQFDLKFHGNNYHYMDDFKKDLFWERIEEDILK